jgi:hypothetical protein
MDLPLESEAWTFYLENVGINLSLVLRRTLFDEYANLRKENSASGNDVQTDI